MSQTWPIKRGDREPKFSAKLAVDNAGQDLTGCSVKFIMKKPGAATPKISAAATIDQTVDSSTFGDVSYSWGATDTDELGLFRAEFEVTFANGNKRTWPADGYLLIQVVEDLG